MAWACKYCILDVGIRGTDKLPETEDEIAEHLEKMHHIPVRRAGETKSHAEARFKQENPDAGGPNCRCPDCRRKKGGRDARIAEMARQAGFGR